jgi:ABC-type lipoprotein release transport system permease subunit
MAAVWYRFRTELRTRWRSAFWLALLVGLAGGIVLTAVAGARRTDSAYPELVRETGAPDILVNPDDGNDSGLVDRYDEVARLPQVARLGVFYGVLVFPLGSSPEEIFTDIQLAPTEPGLYDSFGFNVLEGRLPAPGRIDEVAIDFRKAARDDLGPGDTFAGIPVDVEALMERLGSRDSDALFEAVARGEAGDPIEFTITGVLASPDNLVVDEGFESPYTYFTAALLDEHPGALAGFHGAQATLERGARDETAFRRAVEALVPDETVEFQSRARIDETVERAVRPYTVALWAFAIAVAATAVLVLGQAVARQRFLDAADDAPLATIGCSRGQLLALVGLRTALFAIPGIAVALLLAVLASPLMPIGPASRAEIDPGIEVDAVALGLGAVLLAVVIALLTLLAARRLVLRASGNEHVPRPGIAAVLARTRLGPSATSGIRYAFEPGWGRTAVPARSTLVAAAIAVATVLAALTFAAGLDRLLGTPRLFGVTWQLELEGGGETPEEAQRDIENIDAALRRDVDVAAWSRLDSSRVELEGRNIPAVAITPVEGRVVPTVTSGRAPQADDEVALGKRTLDRLGVDVGDEVDARYQGERVPLTVVGRVVLPGLGNYPGGDKTAPGDGALLTLPGLRAVAPAFEDFSRTIARLDDEADGRAARRRIADRLGGGVDDYRVLGVQQPADVVDLERVRATPVILAALLGLLGAATVAHALVTTIRRRRRDLAMLKTLGFTRGQVSAAIAWQASTIALVAVLVGVPLGVAVGRSAWSLLAADIGVVAEPAVAWLAVALALPVLLVGANLVAAVPAWLAGRTRPAAVLRAE